MSKASAEETINKMHIMSTKLARRMLEDIRSLQVYMSMVQPAKSLIQAIDV